MGSFPEAVEQLHDAILALDGVKDVEVGIRSLEGLRVEELSLPGEYADLPQLVIRRTEKGLENELLVTAEIWFLQDFQGWVALEFLSWWVRDLSRSGKQVQMRSLALPPMAYGLQLGRTLKFVIEFFFPTPDNEDGAVPGIIAAHAESLRESIEEYAVALANPTHADHEDIESLRQSAESEDSSAQLTLARFYENGEGVEKDDAKAFHWYQRAAEHGHPEAVMFLGMCYAGGTGVAADADKAFECYQEAAAGGIPLAMGLLGLCYAEGQGVEEDLTKAVDWYRAGAEAGEAMCQAELGECYEYGKGVAKDLQTALLWYRTALEQGFEDVQPAIDRVESALK